MRRLKPFVTMFAVLLLCFFSCSLLTASEPSGEWTVRRINLLETKVASLEERFDAALAKLDSIERKLSPAPFPVPTATPKSKPVFIAGTWYNQAPNGTLSECPECNEQNCPGGNCSAGVCLTGSCGSNQTLQLGPLSGGFSSSGRFASACGSNGRLKGFGLFRGLCGIFGGGCR